MNKEKIEKKMIEAVKEIATNAVNDFDGGGNKKYFVQILDKLEEACKDED